VSWGARTDRDRGQNASFYHREPLNSANATEAAWAENTACSVGWPSDGVSACSQIPTKLRGERFEKAWRHSLQQLAACG
jgi:hypothetical protein